MQELIKNVSKARYKILNRFYKPIKENILFFHIPKCGGTSIQKAIENCYYPIKNNNPGIYTFRQYGVIQCRLNVKRD